MMYGNIIALAQNNLNDFFAYSSIASAGYILSVAAMNDVALQELYIIW